MATLRRLLRRTGTTIAQRGPSASRLATGPASRGVSISDGPFFAPSGLPDAQVGGTRASRPASRSVARPQRPPQPPPPLTAAAAARRSPVPPSSSHSGPRAHCARSRRRRADRPARALLPQSSRSKSGVHQVNEFAQPGSGVWYAAITACALREIARVADRQAAPARAPPSPILEKQEIDPSKSLVAQTARACPRAPPPSSRSKKSIRRDRASRRPPGRACAPSFLNPREARIVVDLERGGRRGVAKVGRGSAPERDGALVDGHRAAGGSLLLALLHVASRVYREGEEELTRRSAELAAG
jgi:hypothetical protein